MVVSSESVLIEVSRSNSPTGIAEVNCFAILADKTEHTVIELVNNLLRDDLSKASLDDKDECKEDSSVHV